MDRIVGFAELEFIDAPIRTYSTGMAAASPAPSPQAGIPTSLLVDAALAVGDSVSR
jgi:ABC-type polysaccharide/polyol phosphate transport system ATPase subunit